MKRLFILMIALMFAVGCKVEEPPLTEAPTDAPTEEIEATGTATSAPTGEATSEATEAATEAVEDGPTPIPPTPVAIDGVAAETPVLWDIYDPRTESIAPMMEDGGGAFRLDPGFEIARAEFVYQWWGMGDPNLINHVIELQDGQYLKDGETVIAASEMAALAQSLGGMVPTQGYLGSTAHTDDYPSWDIEIVGTDGTHILLNSSANSNDARVPWNMLVNGRFYAQYDGRVARPLSRLFDERLEPDLSLNTDWDGNQLTSIPVDGMYWPAQFSMGFMGLLPISGSFGYYADAEESAIVGYVQGRNIIGFSGLIRQGTVTDLDSIQLTAEGGTIDCTFEFVESDVEYDAAWEFTCPVDGVSAGDLYEYGIAVELATEEGDPVLTEGVLTGTWGAQRDMLLTSGPEPLMSLLRADERAASLLENHLLVFTEYGGSLELGQPVADSFSGTVTFLGQTGVTGRSVRYSLTLPYMVEDGALTYWAAGTDEINAMLVTILSEPVTWHVLNSKPDAVLNLWYSEYDEAMIDEGDLYIPGGMTASTDVCPGDGVSLPSEGVPLRGFAFDENFDYFRPMFLINEDDEVIPSSLVFRFWEEDPLIDVLLPELFKPEAREGLESIVMENGGSWNNFEVNVDWEISEEEYYALKDWAESLPFEMDYEYETIWKSADTLGYVLNDFGEIEFKVCGSGE